MLNFKIILMTLFTFLIVNTSFAEQNDFNSWSLDEVEMEAQKGNIAALKWLKEQKNTDAYLALAYMYENGLGVIPKDYSEAVHWYQLAAEQGDAGAQYIVGIAFTKGAGTKQNYSEGLKWLNQSAKQDYADALTALGDSYRLGRGVQQDDSKAFKYYLQASRQNNLFALYNLGSMYLDGKGVLRSTTQAKKYYKLSCDLGFAQACEDYKMLK